MCIRDRLRSTPGQQAKGRAYLEKVNERKRTWDYFEINHPKAISDKKLEQLKEKYTRRKTEASLLLEKKKEEREVSVNPPFPLLLLISPQRVQDIKRHFKRWAKVREKVKVKRRA